MRLFENKKKNLPMKLQTQKPSTSSLANQLNNSIKNKADKLSKDYNKPLSGTGKPISELKGNAKRNAQLANAGGGSKANGGGGVDEGLKRFMDLARDVGRKEMLEVSTKLKKK